MENLIIIIKLKCLLILEQHFSTSTPFSDATTFTNGFIYRPWHKSRQFVPDMPSCVYFCSREFCLPRIKAFYLNKMEKYTSNRIFPWLQ